VGDYPRRSRFTRNPDILSFVGSLRPGCAVEPSAAYRAQLRSWADFPTGRWVVSWPITQSDYAVRLRRME
jgi:hypothetical protein